MTYTSELLPGELIVIPFPRSSERGGIVGKGVPAKWYPTGMFARGNGKICIVPNGTMPPNEVAPYPYGCNLCKTVIYWGALVKVRQQAEKYILCTFIKHVRLTRHTNEPWMGDWSVGHYHPEILDPISEQ